MSMEYSWQSRNKPLHLWSVGFLTKMTRQFNGEIIVFSTNGRNGHPHTHTKKEKNEVEFLPHNHMPCKHTKNFKLDHRPKPKG